MPKTPRRLELRLPSNHPVWDLPDGFRSKIVREWLEVGRRLTEIEQGLRDLSAKLETNNNMEKTKNIEVSKYTKTNYEFDKNAFLKHFK